MDGWLAARAGISAKKTPSSANSWEEDNEFVPCHHPIGMLFGTNLPCCKSTLDAASRDWLASKEPFGGTWQEFRLSLIN